MRGLDPRIQALLFEACAHLKTLMPRWPGQARP